MANSTLINAIDYQPAVANTTQLDAVVDPTVTSTGFYLEPGFCKGSEVRSKGQLTGAAMVQMAPSAALQLSWDTLVWHFLGFEQLHILNP